MESAVALTHKKRALPWATPTSEFHRESDWATQNSPDIARELHRCDELAVRAQDGAHRRPAADLHAARDGLGGAPAEPRRRAGRPHGHREGRGGARAGARRRSREAEKYYREAANGQAQIVYFVGMAAVAIAISVGAAIWLAIDWASPVAALVAGALGAVVSVIQRINAGKFTLDYDVGRPYAFFLGGLRPLIGGAFALAISFAFTGGLLHLPVAAGESIERPPPRAARRELPRRASASAGRRTRSPPRCRRPRTKPAS